jgi:hypothetical protein
MPIEGRDLTAGHQQQMIEVGLQLAHVVILRDGVVIADRNEVEAARRGCFYRFVQRARSLLSRLAETRAVTVGVVHMQIAAIPCGSGAQGGLAEGRDARYVARMFKIDFGFILGMDTILNIRDPEDQAPLTGDDDSRKVRWRRIGLRECEETLIAATPSAKSLAVEYAQIDAGVLIAPGIGELYRHPRNTLVDSKG